MEKTITKLNREKIYLIASLILASFCLTLYIGNLFRIWGPILSSQSLLAPKISNPVALDFPLHWTASFLTLTGEPASVYDYSRLQVVEKNLTGHGPHPWPYPPTGLLIDLPLALAPYFVSLAIWLTVTMGVYLLVVYRIAPHPLIIFWTVAFLGTFMNFYFGQNGFLSAALLGGGLLLLESHPLVGGMLLGLLSYKPHFFALIPLALLVGRQWRALGGVVVSIFGLFLASVAVFGFDIWLIFLKNTPNTVHNLHTEAPVVRQDAHGICRGPPGGIWGCLGLDLSRCGDVCFAGLGGLDLGRFCHPNSSECSPGAGDFALFAAYLVL